MSSSISFTVDVAHYIWWVVSKSLPDLPSKKAGDGGMKNGRIDPRAHLQTVWFNNKISDSHKIVSEIPSRMAWASSESMEGLSWIGRTEATTRRPLWFLMIVPITAMH